MQSDELLKGARVTDAPAPRPQHPVENPIYPVFTATREHLIGIPNFFERVLTGDGEEIGRFWNVNGKRVGWEGESFQKIKQLSADLAVRKPLTDLVSVEFVMNEVFEWLKESLEQRCAETLADRLARRCEAEVKEVEIWIPMHQTYAKAPFKLGSVTFKPITKEMMEKWYGRIDVSNNPEVKAAKVRERSRLQATLAACSIVRAEPKKASQVAFERAIEASSLLRFLSEANWSCKIRSYVVPSGMEREDSAHELIVANGEIKVMASRALRSVTAAWNVDRNKHLLPGLLEHLDALASDPTSTELRKSLLETLLIYAKNNLTLDPAEKLVFVLVSLESLLLRNDSEPIQSNLADRLAFLVGNTLEERKEIVAATRKTYALRSKFVHHARAIEDETLVDKFLDYAWQALANILVSLDKFESRENLISWLNDRKLTG